jgi:copper chaperone CopZ
MWIADFGLLAVCAGRCEPEQSEIQKRNPEFTYGEPCGLRIIQGMRIATFALLLLALLASPAFACDKCGADKKTEKASKHKQDRQRAGHYAKPKGGKKYVLRVTDMACPNCVEQVIKALRGCEGVLGVEGDDESKTLTITVVEGEDVKEADVKEAIEKAGYTWGGMTPWKENNKPND